MLHGSDAFKWMLNKCEVKIGEKTPSHVDTMELGWCKRDRELNQYKDVILPV